MGWKLRPQGVGHKSVDYCGNNDLFTVKLHHSGKFSFSRNQKAYVNGKVSYIDYCDKDEMSMLELNNMAVELGLSGMLEFYYSIVHADECGFLKHVKIDNDVIDLAGYGGEERCVGVFIDHEFKDWRLIVYDCLDDKLDGPQPNNGVGATENAGIFNEDIHDLLPSVVEGLDFMGYFNGDESQENDANANVVFSAMNNIIDDKDDWGGDDGDFSVGEDSEQSDYYVDDDRVYEDDDWDFDKNVDSDVEWGSDVIDKKGKKPKVVDVRPIPVDTYYDDIAKGEKFKGLKVFNPDIDMHQKITWEIGLCFKDAKTLRDALVKFVVDSGRSLEFPINNEQKIQAKCKKHRDGCPWLLYASSGRNDNTLKIKTLHNRHECLRDGKVVQANARYLGKRYYDKLRLDPDWSVESMKAMLGKETGHNFEDFQMWKVKRYVAKRENGDDGEQYGLLWNYAEEIFRTNPGSTVKIKTKLIGDEAVFKRIYICWEALKRGVLSGCRRVVCLDGCHVKTAYGGVILTAVGIDGNNSIYPIAYAVVEKGKTKSWLWFLDLLVADIEISNSYMWTVISDKQKGLVEAVKEKFPDADHRFCVQHLYSNFKLAHKGLALKDFLWRAARATRPCDFDKVMRELKERDENASLCKARKQPILQMLDMIRLLCMKRISERRKKMLRHMRNICPKIEKILEENKERVGGYAIIWNGGKNFEIRNSSGDIYVIDIGEKTCNCRRWQLTGIPCAHAICCINHVGYKPEMFIADCYKKERYLMTYGCFMNPMHGKEEWPDHDGEKSKLVPPIIQKMPGRPKKHKRKLQPGEENAPSSQFGKQSKKGGSCKCSICKSFDHNKRRCPYNSNLTMPKETLDIPAPDGRSKTKKTNARSNTKVSGAGPSATKATYTFTYGSSNTFKQGVSNEQMVSTHGKAVKLNVKRKSADDFSGKGQMKSATSSRGNVWFQSKPQTTPQDKDQSKKKSS